VSRAKRLLFLTHRWMGIALCLFLAMWFVSGVVMMYVGYPKLTHAERLARLPPLSATDVTVSPVEAVSVSGITSPPTEIRLARSVAGRAVYLVSDHERGGKRRQPYGKQVVVDAGKGVVLNEFGTSTLLGSALHFSPGSELRDLGEVSEDAWTHSRALDPHRPLRLIELNDADRTWLYVSGKTGEVVRDATQTERFWNYLGAWIHWLYPFRDTVVDAYWADIIIWLSLASLGLVVAGIAIGWMRWRCHVRYANGSRSPYREKIMRWHHVVGLAFSITTLTWVFSGLMSMNPWKVFDSGAPPLNFTKYTGGPLDVSQIRVKPADIVLAMQAAGGNVREIKFIRVAGEQYVLALDGSGAISAFDGRSRVPQRVSLDGENLKQAARMLLPDSSVVRISELLGYDAYYYARAPHTMSGVMERPLPVWRVEFDDPGKTWVHIDPATGAIVGRLDTHQRVKRWLFAFLHSWDWLPLLNSRPIWDALLILLSLGGVILSVTGTIAGWRRLRRAALPRRTTSA